MTLPNASPVFYNEGEEVSTGRRQIALNPEATVFEPPSYVTENKSTASVDLYMNNVSQSSCGGDTVPTTDLSERFMRDDEAICDNESPTNSMTEEKMATSTVSQEVTDVPCTDNGTNTSETVSTETITERQELPKEKIIQLVLEEVPFFFSRENWSSDPYLLSQMDGDQYVPIHVLASCSQFKQITKNHYSIMDALKQSELVQLDIENHRVRPNYKRCIVILREIPEATPPTEIENLFSHDDCPNVVSCEFINNDSWYVTFDNDDDAQKAYRHLRETVKTFKEKPIAARIKTKPLTRQNCFAVLPRQPKQQLQAQQPEQTHQSNGTVPPLTAANSIPQAAVPSPYMGSQRLFYPASATPYGYFPNVSSQVQQTSPAFFYPNPMMQWPTSNGNFYDMSSFLSYNGLSPKATFKPAAMNTRFPTAGNLNNSKGRGKKWDRNESRSQSVSSAASACRASSISARSNTPAGSSFNAGITQASLGHVNAEGGFPAAASTLVQNELTSLNNQGIYSSFSPPVTAELDVERSNAVSPLVSSDYASGPFLTAGSYDGQTASAQMIPINYNATVPSFAPILYRNGFGNTETRQGQRNNGGGRRRPRREEDPNNGQGRGSHHTVDRRRGSQDRAKPQFNLQDQARSFPPLPGSDEGTTETVVVDEPVEQVSIAAWTADTQKFSDVMKGTAKSKIEKAEAAPLVTSNAPSTNPTTNISKSNQASDAVETSQAAAKPKQVAAITDTKLNSAAGSSASSVHIEQPSTKSAPRTQPSRDQRVNRREHYHFGNGKGKKDNAKSGCAYKDTRPNLPVRPNVKKETPQEAWNKLKGNKLPLAPAKSSREADSVRNNPKLQQRETRPLTNGDISPPPPPSSSRVEADTSSKTKKEKVTIAIASTKKDIDAPTNQPSTSGVNNSMSWAKMAKSGKDEMEKLSAVIKEKEEQERIKKNRGGGRPQVTRPQEKVIPGKEPKSFRRDINTQVRDKANETKTGSDKNQGPIVKTKEFRPKSPKPQ